MLWRKPDGMKYTDLCIYIDKHVDMIVNPGENPQEEELIYNYIWLLVKALAIKKRMFENFNDYDGYAMHCAKRLFFALRKSRQNEGKVIKGRTITPIKSILNYTKALMYPMKLEYLSEQLKLNQKADVINKQYDLIKHKQSVRDEAWSQQDKMHEYKFEINLIFKSFSSLLTQVLEKAPFPKESIEYKRLRISILLNCLNNLRSHRGFVAEPITVLVWKLPKSTNTYIKLFMKKLGTLLKTEIIESYKSMQIDDKILDFMITNQSGEFISHEE